MSYAADLETACPPTSVLRAVDVNPTMNAQEVVGTDKSGDTKPGAIRLRQKPIGGVAARKAEPPNHSQSWPVEAREQFESIVASEIGLATAKGEATQKSYEQMRDVVRFKRCNLQSDKHVREFCKAYDVACTKATLSNPFVAIFKALLKKKTNDA